MSSLSDDIPVKRRSVRRAAALVKPVPSSLSESDSFFDDEEIAKAQPKKKGTKAKAKSRAKGKSVKKETEKKPLRARAKAKPKSTIKPETEPSIWTKLGQKNFSPPQGDGYRVYYESSYEQEPNNYIAIRYMIENGCFESGSVQLEESYEKYCAIKEAGGYRKVGGLKPELDSILYKISKKYKTKQTEDVKQEISE